MEMLKCHIQFSDLC